MTLNRILSMEDRENLDTNKEELGTVLFQMKSGKPPGCDSLGPEFYKTFWPQLQKPLFETYIEAKEKGILSLFNA